MIINPHLALAALHLVLTAILYVDGALAEAVCTIAVSAIYAAMPPGGH